MKIELQIRWILMVTSFLFICTSTASAQQLEVEGPVKGSLYFLGEKLKLLPAGSGSNSIRFENDQEILAEFDASIGSDPPTFKVEQIRFGNVKIGNRFTGVQNELYMHIDQGVSDAQLMRLGSSISAINTNRLFLTSVSLLHGPSSTGSTGLTIYNTGGNQNGWNLYTANGSGNLEFFHNGAIKARVRATDGAWVTNSDRRLKTEIAALGTILPKLMKLQASTYQFSETPSDKGMVGFIAQDVEDVFPDLVYFDTEKKYFGLNYADFGVLAVKGLQELAEKLTLERNRNDQLREELDMLRMDMQRLERVVLEKN